MSDEDRDIDIESDIFKDTDPSMNKRMNTDTCKIITLRTEDDELGANTQFMTQAEKRAHHNALERKRRDHIKESFHSLRDSIPSLQGEKSSRAQILKQATDYIMFMSKKNSAHQQDIDDLKKQNQVLDQEVRLFEKTKAAGTFAASQSANVLDGSTSSNKTRAGGASAAADVNHTDSSDSEAENTRQRSRKKLKT